MQMEYSQDLTVHATSTNGLKDPLSAVDNDADQGRGRRSKIQKKEIAIPFAILILLLCIVVLFTLFELGAHVISVSGIQIVNATGNFTLQFTVKNNSNHPFSGSVEYKIEDAKSSGTIALYNGTISIPSKDDKRYAFTPKIVDPNLWEDYRVHKGNPVVEIYFKDENGRYILVKHVQLKIP